ncbi:hypothetical protein KP509_14G069700 [Ceratopteris richardii]|uniref:Uncharacterized protein n=1 Tax=Ceratopteris richardii TaxID=49495 RepID=A0A8T2TE01_CERRI|nr:hypothetical protein KP509_14G069700 [Ceratopteris richardii]
MASAWQRKGHAEYGEVIFEWCGIADIFEWCVYCRYLGMVCLVRLSNTMKSQSERGRQIDGRLGQNRADFQVTCHGNEVVFLFMRTSLPHALNTSCADCLCVTIRIKACKKGRGDNG